MLGLVSPLFRTCEIVQPDAANGACYVIGQGFIGKENDRRQACLRLRGVESILRTETRLDVLFALELLSDVRLIPTMTVDDHRKIESALNQTVELPAHLSVNTDVRAEDQSVS